MVPTQSRREEEEEEGGPGWIWGSLEQEGAPSLYSALPSAARGVGQKPGKSEGRMWARPGCLGRSGGRGSPPPPPPHPRPLCSRPPFLQRRLHEGGGCRLWSLLRRQGLGAGRALGEGVLINPAGRSGTRAAARPPWDPSFLSQTGRHVASPGPLLVPPVASGSRRPGAERMRRPPHPPSRFCPHRRGRSALSYRVSRPQ